MYKSKIMKYILALFLIIPALTNLYSQESVDVPMGEINQDWGVFYENGQIKLSSKVEACTDPAGGPTFEKVFISIENKSTKQLLINWHYDRYSTLGCRTCNDIDDEYLLRMVLTPLQKIVPDCAYYKIEDPDSGNIETLGVYKSHSGQAQDSDTAVIILSDFSVTEIN
jgi:hypothetical protein